jgi:hypothetical protein
MSQIVYGLKAKTINVQTEAGLVKFKLQQNNELGLPKDAQIVAIQTRESSDTITGSDGRKLVATSVFNNAYLTLKTMSCPDGGPIMQLVSQVPLTDFVRQALFFQETKSSLIDWNESFIQINKRATADVANLRSFELVVYYLDSCNELIEPRFDFRNGNKRAGIRKAYFEVALNEEQNKYSLSNSPNIGLPSDAMIVGYNTFQNGLPLYGMEGLTSDLLANTYFTLKQGTWSFIDEYPAALNDYKNTLFADLEYMPMSQIMNNKIDWQQSHIIIKDISGISNDMVFQFFLYYYQK